MGESLHVCAYERCGRAFDSPVRLTDLSRRPQETYYACPYCFSKMDETDGEVIDHFHGGGYELSVKDGAKKGLKGGGHKELERTVDCPHHVGYLKTRSKNEAVPDTCLTCQKILQCMVSM